MKKIYNIVLSAAVAVAGFTSCANDDIKDESIFNVRPNVIDKSLYSAPLDSFCKKNFLENYNLDFKYKMVDISSDVNKNLQPASYEKCEEMAVLVKYLWYDVYKNLVGLNGFSGLEFLKKNSPRIIHLIGSKNMNPVQGTEVLGTAEGGIKVTLYRGNTLDISDLDYCNRYFFKTMHHEFGHILHSNYVVPLEYRTISSGFYDALGWQNTCDSVAHGDGFVTQYSRNNYNDDFVEMLSVYVTATPQKWQTILDRAKFQWEEVTFDKDSKGWTEFEKILARYNRNGGDIDSIGYVKEKTTQKLTIVRKLIKRQPTEDKNDYAYSIPDEDGKPQFIFKEEGKTGTELIIKKLGILTDWLKEHYKLDIEELHKAVMQRSYMTDDNGELVLGSDGNPINRIVQPYQGYPTLLEYLVTNMRNYTTIDSFDFIK